MDGLSVMCGDLCDVFERIIKPDLYKSLDAMRAYFNAYNVNEKDQNKVSFRVLLVGGFSNFYLVEQAVRQFFGSVTGGDDQRFEGVGRLSKNNKKVWHPVGEKGCFLYFKEHFL